MEDPKRGPGAAAASRDAERGARDDRERNEASSLARALRRARLDAAERSQAVAELRYVELARLEMLEDALEPLLAEVPPHVDLFDVAIAPGAHPRLFIDVIGFVEIAPDRRTYRLVQDARHGRVALVESASIGEIVNAVADYMAHRLIEREKALVSDEGLAPSVRRRRATPDVAAVSTGAGRGLGRWRPCREEVALSRTVATILSFLIEVFGSAAFFMLLAIGGWCAWKALAAWIAAR
ncbi:hypothetical protein [Methylocapsa acidiphila]|uniref:hypothetical protein n=1 Tax=Methylocapsa acidiphila TaxID=133552 RepID=UPI000420989A|nr:hypothetical protein [Methylocapsa acidiphila]